MSYTGLGVVIRRLGSNRDSVDAFISSVGKKITDLKIEDNELKFTFEDDTRMSLADHGQSCCEHRYMNTDDELSYHVGATLLEAEISDGGTMDHDYSTKECQFLRVKTSKGTFVIKNYNEHNGFYGGFSIEAKKL